MEESTILIVDDNPTNLKVLMDYLKGLGFRMLVATSGERAVQQLTRTQPDLILLDVMMPGIDGFETCRQIKRNEQTADIPVIFMTALAETTDKVNGFKAGAVDYVTKPFQQEEVLARITTHLTLQRQKKELKALNATKDKFFSIIAHDLRGPFTSLIGFSSIFIDRSRKLSPEQVEDFGTIIHKSAKNTLRLLDNLLNWARLQRGIVDYEPELTDLAQFVDESLALLNQAAEPKQITIINQIPPHLVADIDPNMIETVYRNLISNAIKFTPHGGEIRLKARGQPNDKIECVVQDTGVGMDADSAARLFKIDTAFSTEGTNGERGTGLGLILCYEFIRQHQGEIWVESALGQGTTFYFTVPRLTLE